MQKLSLLVVRAPVWTAFITQYLGTRSWIRRPDSKVVVLRELRQTIFMFAADYTPQKTSRGDHILQFTNRAGKFCSSQGSQGILTWV
jgi:hypothetical protein